MIDKNSAMALRIAQCAADKGGRAYYVGGYVRDRLMHRENKDIDMEIHGISYEDLDAILSSLGERTVMGAAFGVFGLKHYNIDIAMPRREKATGRGHKDFAIYVDPFIGTQRAAIRRDFTMNAMMEDVLTGEVIDHFGGREDLEKGILRHVNTDSFQEDPLRVLRAAQFAARFDFSVAPETMELCSHMDLTALARERITDELAKALMKADKPSVFFRILREMRQLRTWFGEIADLIGVEQSPKWHPEGDAWEHTMLTLDAAASLKKQTTYPAGFMYAALLHDVGKVATTVKEEDGRIRSLRHEEAGVPIAESMLRRLTDEQKLIKYVLNMVRWHMKPNLYVQQHSSKKAFMHLWDSAISPEDLAVLSRADRMGQTYDMALYEEDGAFIQSTIKEYRDLMKQPCVMGADLMKNGIKPGPRYGELLAYAHKLHLASVPYESALKQTLLLAGIEEKESKE